MLFVLTTAAPLQYNNTCMQEGLKNVNPQNTSLNLSMWTLEGGEIYMPEVKNNGNLEEALKRFKRQCARNQVLQEVRKREHYEKPSVRRKKKSEAARKRKY